MSPGPDDYPPPPRPEPHWPAQLTIALAIVLQVLLPQKLRAGPQWLLAGLEGLMLIALIVASPQRIELRHQTRRRFALAISALVSLTNGISLALLVHYLFRHTQAAGGHELILAGGAIWLTNALVFSLWYWELDRGGPGRRAAGEDGIPDFLFPQMGGDTAYDRGWRPVFLDYLYVSFTNATAFSPTDTMPLSIQAKAIMGIQSLISLVTLGLVISRAVNIL